MPFNLPIFYLVTHPADTALFVGVFNAPQSLLSATDKVSSAPPSSPPPPLPTGSTAIWPGSGANLGIRRISRSVADKLMVAAALIVLVHLNRFESLDCRGHYRARITISALRESDGTACASRSVGQFVYRQAENRCANGRNRVVVVL